MLLINKTDIQVYKQLPTSLDDSRLTPYIMEAQEFDLKEALGYPLYYDMLKELPNETSGGKYTDLLNGVEYIDRLGHSILFLGIKPAIVYWTYARLIENQQLTITATGVNVKTNQYSDMASQTEISKRVTQARSGAYSYFQTAEKFLIDKNIESRIYPLWLIGLNETKSGGIRMTTVDRFTRESTVKNNSNNNYYKR